MNPEISRELLGKIVDECFDGAIEDCKVIEDIYRVIARESVERIYTNTDRIITMDDRQFSYEGNGYIQDNNFDFDAALVVSGDFIDDEKDRYAEMIVGVLNNATMQISEPTK